MELVVGMESTWSLRVWLCAKLVNIELTEVVIDLSVADHKTRLNHYSPSGLVPVLTSGSLVVHDSLAIIEFLNELTKGALYPPSLEDRAVARSLCAEMHSGFSRLRQQCPFRSSGATPFQTIPDDLQQELLRVEAIFAQAEGPFMFATPGAVDACYAILACRLQQYGIYLSGDAGKYQQSLLQWPLLKTALKQAAQWQHSV
ncbi:glutathione S-transferase N-terminal domain-containing protein [Marinomonas pollencensis]|uniref:Glutathione S-transferase n=1 Tax=Marinomonas pollencensis TaxID=491954 RepID=A0A3E0DN64_9GAMM|nr:glutathione S-transferase N-terminal domain-containing protein [Marinomonas pollencensis]REG84277.1 glutathione S-transferase [Marinomonas pollencensis]